MAIFGAAAAFLLLDRAAMSNLMDEKVKQVEDRLVAALQNRPQAMAMRLPSPSASEDEDATVATTGQLTFLRGQVQRLQDDLLQVAEAVSNLAQQQQQRPPRSATALSGGGGHDQEDACVVCSVTDERLAMVELPKTCDGLCKYGLNESGMYHVDPDGFGLGEPPIKVYCDFVLGTTEVPHDSESAHNFTASNCVGSECDRKEIDYGAVPMSQLEALMSASEQCSQYIKFDCRGAPVVGRGRWLDRSGDPQTYLYGANYGNTCMEMCSCSTTKSMAWLSDEGTITNMTALPITGFDYGPLPSGAAASITFGRLICSGTKAFADVGENCRALKRDGQRKSGFYVLSDSKVDNTTLSIAFCDMMEDKVGGTVDDVVQRSRHDVVTLENVDDVRGSENMGGLLAVGMGDEPVQGDVAAVLGEGVDLTCTSKVSLKSCLFGKPDGDVLTILPGVRYAEDIVPNMDAEEGKCGIRLNKVKEKDGGMWKCKVSGVHDSRFIQSVGEFNLTVVLPAN